MDAATLKVAKNYTNEQAAQKATNSPVEEISFDGGIYSVGNNVVNGQVSDVVLKGRSLKQELDYNRDTWEEWTKAAGIVSESTGLEITADGTNVVTAIIDTNLKSNTKYGLLYRVVFSSIASGFFGFGNVSRAINFGTGVKAIGNQKAISTSFNPITNNTFVVFVSDTVSSGEKVKLKDIRIFELPAGSEIESDFNTMTADQLAQKYPYIKGDSVKSTNSVRVKSVGKNLFDKFVCIGTSSAIKNGEVYTLSFAFANYLRINNIDNKKLKPNTTYTLSFNVKTAGVIGDVLYYNGTSATISLHGVGQKKITFTTNADGYNDISIRNYNGTSSTVTIENIQVEEGAVVTTYEPYKESIVTTPEVGKSLPNGVKDEVNVTTGVKTQRVKDYVLQASNINALHTMSANIDIVSIAKPVGYIGKGNLNLINGNARMEGTNGDKEYKDSTEVIGYLTNAFNNSFGYCVAKGTYANLAAAQTALAGTTLTYQLATPIVTKLPAQAPLQVFENGTVYVEPIGDASESTLPSVEMTIPAGTSNKFGVASHDYDGDAADWTLTNSESKCFLLAVSSAGGAANIIAPDAPGVMYAVKNASGQTITVKTSGGTGVAITNGKKVLVIHDGTDYTALTAEL